jgi:multiple sugar transport system substrate-binding protein
MLAADADNLTVGVVDGKTTLKPEQIVRSLETVAAIDQYANNMAQWDEAAIEAFKSDQLAFLLDGPWTEPGIIDSGVKYDAVLVPAFEEGGRTGGMQGWDFMYGVNSGDEAKNDAIIRWLKFLGEYEQEKAWTINVGRSTLREDVMSDPEVLVTMMAQVTAKGLQGGMKQMDFVHSNVFWASALGDVAPMVASGEITAEEGAALFIEKVNGLYAEAGE